MATLLDKPKAIKPYLRKKCLRPCIHRYYYIGLFMIVNTVKAPDDI